MSSGTRLRCLDPASGLVLARRVEAAHSLPRRIKGLLGRRELAPDQGLWLRPCRQVHTWFMRFPIDVLFLDRELVVVGLVRNLGPWRLSPFYFRARSALELAAGRARDLAPGQRLVFERIAA